MPLSADLQSDLDALAAAGLRRECRVFSGTGKWVEVPCCPQPLLHGASNDYLGLATHPALRDAATEAAARFGTGAGASRLITGTLPPHTAAETAFAAFKHAPAALLLPTGFMANLAVLTTLAGDGDLIVQDKLNHASLMDGAKYSGAQVRTFPHLGYAKAERLLAEATGFRRKFLVTDSIFSMDGDAADLRQCADLCAKHGATLVVDEAHGTGVFGASGAGVIEEMGLTDHPAVKDGVVVSTASKALGGLGGIVTGSRAVIETLVHRGRPFIYTTSVPPAQAAALEAAVVQVQSDAAPRLRLRAMATQVREALAARGWDLPPSLLPTPIIPLVTGSAESALALADRLKDRGILALAVRPPTVAPGAARVRLTLRADFNDDEVALILDAVGAPGTPASSRPGAPASLPAVGVGAPAVPKEER